MIVQCILKYSGNSPGFFYAVYFLYIYLANIYMLSKYMYIQLRNIQMFKNCKHMKYFLYIYLFHRGTNYEVSLK